MPQPWQPEHPVDLVLARRLIGARFPDLSLDELEYLGAGWDNDVWRCGAIVFRFPHRPEAVALIEKEWAVLPHLVDRLSLPIPRPLHRGSPGLGYPATFVGYRWIAGALPRALKLTEADQDRAAEPLAGFLRDLHTVPTAEAKAWGAPTQDEPGDMGERVHWSKRRAEDLCDTAHADLARKASAAMIPPPAEAQASEFRLMHGDLHAGQLLFDDQHVISGVIDWGNLSIGDPAYDLQIVPSFLSPGAQARFWSIYGPVGQATMARARFIALSYGLALITQAVAIDDASLEAEAAKGLVRVLASTT